MCVHVSAHVCKALFVGCCCLSVVCPSWRFHQGIYDRFVSKLFALWVHSVGMWVQLFAKLGLRIVVACRWFVKAGSFICVSIMDLVLNRM